jgi:ribonuclease HII
MSSKTYPTLQTESKLFERGNRFVIGIDEVGRGAIAGPVAVGVSLIDKQNPDLNSWPEKLQDSKLMTPKSRPRLLPPLRLGLKDTRLAIRQIRKLMNPELVKL